MQALKKAGITPDSSKTYQLSDIESAAATLHGGKKVYFSCKSGELNAAYYYYHLRGNAINGQYIPVDTRMYSLSLMYLLDVLS